VTLTNITVTDDQGVQVSCPASELDPDASMTCTGNGTAQLGQYANIGTVIGTSVLDESVQVTDSDPSHYFGVKAAITIKKYTNGVDADLPVDAPEVEPGSTVNWTYVVQNTGNITLTNVTVTDNEEGPICEIQSLAPEASDNCEKTGIAGHGLYANIATVVGTPAAAGLPNVTDDDPSHYYGRITPSIALKKYTNGHDADEAPGPIVEPGSTVTWTYVVQNTGNIALTNVIVTDDVEGDICI